MSSITDCLPNAIEQNARAYAARLQNLQLQAMQELTMPIVDYATFIPMVGASYFSTRLSADHTTHTVADLVSLSFVDHNSYIDVEFDYSTFSWEVQERNGYNTVQFNVSLFLTATRDLLFVKFQRIRGNSELFHRAVNRFVDTGNVRNAFQSVSARNRTETALNGAIVGVPRRRRLNLQAPDVPSALKGHVSSVTEFEQYMLSLLSWVDVEPIEALRSLLPNCGKIANDLQHIYETTNSACTTAGAEIMKNMITSLTGLVVSSVDKLEIGIMHKKQQQVAASTTKATASAYDFSQAADYNDTGAWADMDAGTTYVEDGCSSSSSSSIISAADPTVSVCRSVGMMVGPPSFAYCSAVASSVPANANDEQYMFTGTIKQSLGHYSHLEESSSSYSLPFNEHQLEMEIVDSSSVAVANALHYEPTTISLPDFLSQDEYAIVLSLSLACLLELSTQTQLPAEPRETLQLACRNTAVHRAFQTVAVHHRQTLTSCGRSVLRIRGDSTTYFTSMQTAAIVQIKDQILDNNTCSHARQLLSGTVFSPTPASVR